MFWTALILGFFGSLHCLGMCGPIVLVLPGRTARSARFVAGRLLYNGGRAVTYALLGAAVGVLGQFVVLAGYQQTLGIVAGVLMIAGVAFPAGALSRAIPARMTSTLAALKGRLGSLLESDALSSLFFIGLLNGLLPCGLVYSALAASIAAGGIAQGALFMALFGLGTLPAMFALGFAGGLLTAGMRRRLVRAVPVMVALMGVFFILRGLALGIPFVSPKMERMLAKGTTVIVDTTRAVPDSTGHDCCAP
ncbi:MAG: sulfite exporter TauE/SafE family protein [Ignavibacteria bacterium]|nr:sulfite exporter TauE/SafE family protein [Ignavibacteria bacterium]